MATDTTPVTLIWWNSRRQFELEVRSDENLVDCIRRAFNPTDGDMLMVKLVGPTRTPDDSVWLYAGSKTMVLKPFDGSVDIPAGSTVVMRASTMLSDRYSYEGSEVVDWPGIDPDLKDLHPRK